MDRTSQLPSGYYRRVYVWELPVRAFHWINALAITLLVITGYFIGNPVFIQRSLEASSQYIMGTAKVIHFLAAYVLVMNFAIRIYWAFRGNEYAHWREFFPFLTKEGRDEIKNVIKVDILQVDLESKISIGHNALASMVYFFLFIFTAFQVFTGFALYADMSDAFIPQLFAWFGWFFDGNYEIREWHHLSMWFFILFTIVHIYLTFYHDYVEGRATVSSMVGGWKFCRRERLIVDDEDKT